MSEIDLLQTDCSKCAALCCLVLAFDKGKDFAFSKNPCEPCRNLSHHACGIHDDLMAQGMSGCVAYDCLGAGNRVVQEVFDGRSWRDDARLTSMMMEAFSAMREVHKRIDLLRAAQMLPLAPQDEHARAGFLARLEDQRWEGQDLAEFDVGLGLEIDLYFHTIRDLWPAPPPADGKPVV
ncbi:hypothetical protein AQS8620_03281 [Aquimixticola soesokkakensis]|uniref:Pentapeptide repeats (8 copies) n=1 Tax=Aquimixticola soesokkakensis TaxID=1519096 RepID=A0A1Y5TTQ7_9RHOB|nr:hypothetical protein [Aquimixticola soesokkakensis]SLN69469.1 hypothetical protein AQS8620_03281 [Aquimixticola soesokkakensis]